MGGATDPAANWIRAGLGLAIMAALTEGDRHGYALAQRLAEFGLGPIRGGALYPVLNRLESEAAVRSDWLPGEGGPGRKVYAITEAGRQRLADERTRWGEFTDAFDRLLTATSNDNGSGSGSGSSSSGSDGGSSSSGNGGGSDDQQHLTQDSDWGGRPT
ncbi:PadR family transcriptional regulator PadR [Micromonospora sp. Llam0]|uniref:PadR family transcriptional regulator n=1 Tax=Micromonospora sp. Llam0 TaxID=2485143 RepID=UPI000F4A0665|nr:PadR family transcriptional regulator [Micromonospora sp. Llam0]ROO58502.1 PadR family transcriptional regulator PadR [Micromonospora sp. Llam0]